MLVRIVKNWGYPDLMRQTPGHTGVWDDVQFTLDAVDSCDYLVVLNNLSRELKVNCPLENVWSVFQEPYVKGFNAWMRYGHEQYSRVYTCHAPSNHKRYRIAHPMVPWQVGKGYDELVKDTPGQKTDKICWITSDLTVLPGHKLRHDFYKYVSRLNWPELEVYGRGIAEIDDKWDVLSQGKYSLAIENCQSSDYWTEKIADCWLAHSLPFYYGCLNLEDYFPSDSFIRIDLSNFSRAVESMRAACESGEYEKRVDAIEEARQLVLQKRQFFPELVAQIKKSQAPNLAKREIKLEPYELSVGNAFKENIYRRLKSIST